MQRASLQKLIFRSRWSTALPLVVGCSGLLLLLGRSDFNAALFSTGLFSTGLGWILGAVGAVLLLGGALIAHSFRAAGQRRADYQSGRVELVERALADEQRWGSAPQQLRALAMCGLGQFASARRALSRHWDAERRVDSDEDELHELSLCAQVLIESFEGRQGRALRLCRDLLGRPVAAGAAQRVRREARRAGTVAVARAVAGAADEHDYEALGRAATFEPSMYWACRYGAAMACWGRHEHALARRLIENAPQWPEHSVFRELHERLMPGAARGLSQVA